LGQSRDQNPASLYRFALQNYAYGQADTALDLVALARWHEFCAAQGLEYSFNHEQALPLTDVLAQICAAGRATPAHDGLKFTVVVDGINDLVDHVSGRNSRRFSSTRQYQNLPHAWRIGFLDETNFYTPAERLVPRPGFVGEITVTEKLEMPGKTNPVEIYKEGLRRWKEIEHRPDVYTVEQDGAARVAVRGDRVIAAFENLDETLVAARVTAVRNGMNDTSFIVTVDETISGQIDIAYGCRWLTFTNDAQDFVISTASLVTPIVLLLAEGDSFAIQGSAPNVGDIVYIGPISSQPLDLIVTRIERGEGNVSILTLVDSAPQIDADVDAAIIPAWSPRVGDNLGASNLVPAAPVYVSIASGLASTGIINGLRILLRPGTSSPALVGSYEISHRRVGTATWNNSQFSAAAGGGLITTYAVGDSVEFQCLARSIDSVAGPFNSLQTITIGSQDAPSPSGLASVTVQGTAGHIFITVGTSSNTDEVRIYTKVGIGGVLDTIADLKQNFDATPGIVYQTAIGDATRNNLASNAGFDTNASWAGNAWTLANSKAAHTAGDDTALSQAIPLTAGKAYRGAFKVQDYVAGSVTVQLGGGGAIVSGTTASGNGVFYFSLNAVTGNNALEFKPTTDFDGSVDDIIFYENTPISLPQGSHEVWVQPFNDGIEGPISGPIAAIVI
jgi:hypothetical protein